MAAMISRDWSINSASVELGVDRRTIARRIDHHQIKPVSDGPGGVALYKLRDLHHALTGACWDCSWLDAKDDCARKLFVFFDSEAADGGLPIQDLLDRVEAAPRENKPRALREHFAALLWVAIGAEERAFLEPRWSELPPRTFLETWRALAGGAHLADVLSLSRGEWPQWWGLQDDTESSELLDTFAEMQRERAKAKRS